MNGEHYAFDDGSNSYNTYASSDGVVASSDGYDVQEYAAEYWRLDAEALVCFQDLCPDACGESVSLSDLNELCDRMGRPVRDANEQCQLLLDLDTTNAMVILRHDFVTWLLQDLLHERALERARLEVRQSRAVPVAEPVWEEIVLIASPMDSVSDASASEPTLSKYYYNVRTGESKWTLPSFIECLWRYVTALETTRIAMSDPVASLVTDDQVRNIEMLQDLHALFRKYDDDASGALDSAEFEDLCVAVGQPLSSSDSAGTTVLRTLMRDVDPFSAQDVVSWDALSYYWVMNAPFQRRTRLALEAAKSEVPASVAHAWERVDVLHKRNLAVTFRNAETLVERWSHPEMEQRVVALVLGLVPSAKLDWTKKIALFFQVQLDASHSAVTSSSAVEQSTSPSRMWDLAQCARVLVQLAHPMTRKRHLETAIQQLQRQFSPAASADTSVLGLDEATVTAWCLYCVHKVEMRGWEEVVEPASGQVYYYHEVRGATQWDPPEMASRMTRFLAKFSGSGAGSSDERIARIFRHYDVDESGSISRDEFAQFYRALLLSTDAGGAASSSTDDRAIAQLFDVLDTGGDDNVSLDEFTIWWRTKLQLEEEETEDAKVLKRFTHRRELCRSFLESADALRVRPATASSTTSANTDDSSGPITQAASALPDVRECFETIQLPRLVAILGKYALKGLAYRHALQALVKDAATQEVELEAFLVWYDAFEAAEREREELQAARARAQAELQAREKKTQAKAYEKKMRAKRRRKLGDAALSLAQLEAPLSVDAAQRKRVESLFQAFDTNDSGCLDANELMALTKALGYAMDAVQVRQMLQVMDTSGDGQVSLDEFLTFWTAFQRAKPTGATASKSIASGASPSPVPSAQMPRKHTRTSVVDATASLTVGLEMAKTRALKFSLADFRDAISDWRDDLADKRNDRVKAQQRALEEAAEAERRRTAFVPTRTRKYGASLDVTWIEPEVVACVADMIARIRATSRPLLRPDAAHAIQTLARAYITRERVRRYVEWRFHQHTDVATKLFYYEDHTTGAVVLERPLFKVDSVSSVAPFELDDCTSKHERYAFLKRQRSVAAKKRFYDRYQFADTCQTPSNATSDDIGAQLLAGDATAPERQPPHRLFVPAAFYVYDIAQQVRTRLLGDIWSLLRQQQHAASTPANAIRIELMAMRYHRQLQQRSSDGAAYLPLHYVVRHAELFPLRVVAAIARGYPDALLAVDAFGMTPLHLALRERRSSLALLRLVMGKCTGARLDKRARQRLWRTMTRCGDTPLHTAVRHCVPIELLRWLLQHRESVGLSLDTVSLLNAHGVSAFHVAIEQFGCSDRHKSTSSGPSASDGAAYAKAVVHTFFKHVDATHLCLLPTKRGDLPLHLAMGAFERTKQSQTTQANAHTVDNASASAWVWLTQRLLGHCPSTLLERKTENGLLPIHLAIKYGFPAPFVAELWRATLARITQMDKATALNATMLPQMRTTLLHYALLYAPDALELVEAVVDAMPDALKIASLPDDDLPLHVAVTNTVVTRARSDDRRLQVVRLLCARDVLACQTYNRQRQLPLHLAIASTQPVVIVETLLQSAPFALHATKDERNGLRALVLAASVACPDYAVLRALVDETPSVCVATPTRDRNCSQHSRSVTPLAAIALRPEYRQRPSNSEQSRRDVLATFRDKFEALEDADAYFDAMAREKLRRKHRCPTRDWTFSAILRLIDLNPLNEALIQRAFAAINAKLQVLSAASNQLSHTATDASSAAESDAAVAAIALDIDLAIVRRVHEVLYDVPANARIQVLGQSVLTKLLPTAFAKAAYKAKVDPYFNL